MEQGGELLGLVVDREGERASVHAEMAVVALLLGLVRLFDSRVLSVGFWFSGLQRLNQGLCFWVWRGGRGAAAGPGEIV